MKKILFLFAALLTCMSAGAQVFTPPTDGEYPGSFVVNVSLKVNGEAITGQTKDKVEIGAFVDGTCRATIAPNSQSSQSFFSSSNNLFTLRAWGNDTDDGKDVSFRVVVDGIVYRMKTTVPYEFGKTYKNDVLTALELNVDHITGVTLPESIKITQKIGTTYDLSKHIGFAYAKGYEPKGESSVDESYTTFVYAWDADNASSWFTIDDNVLTIVDECKDIYLGLQLEIDETVASVKVGEAAGTLVTIEEPKVAVTEIKTKADSYECWNGDNLGNILNGEIIVLPDDASDKSVEFIQKSGPEDGMNAKGTFEKAGTYTITIQSVSTPEITKDITVVVKQHVESIACTQTTTKVTVNVGENVFDAIKAVVTVLPENATNKNLELSTNDSEYIDGDGIALKKSGASFLPTVSVVPEDNAAQLEPLSFSVEILDPVTAIRISPTSISVYEGDNVRDYITKNVTVTAIYAKRSAETVDYNAVPSDDDAEFFTNNIANKAGSYTWVISSTEDEDIKTNLSVTVIEPVVLSCDGYAELTLLTPGQATLTLEKGKAIFDPKLVTVETEKGVASTEVSSDGLTITFTGLQVASSFFNVLYDGNLQCSGKLEIGGELKLQGGWNWISNYVALPIDLTEAAGESYVYKDEYFKGDNKITEIRSQAELLFNDPTYGLFGQITTIEPSTMYKVRTAGTMSFESFGRTVQSEVNIYLKGYSWIGYPVIGDHSFKYINDNGLLKNSEDGDMIIGKNGFATFDAKDGWVAQQGFKLETGKGYIYYQEEATQKSLNFGDNYVEEQTPAGVKAVGPRANVWHFDANAFPETMCIVTRINGIEAADRYSVGAFVDGECRGMGTFVNDDVMFISVAGKSGETVSFRLYNAETEEYTEIPETMKYTMMRGSLKNPAYLSANEATGIQTLSEPTANGQQPTFNLAGQAVGGDYKGIVIKNGKKYLNK